MLLKITLFGVMQCVYAVRGKEKHIIFHILYIIVASLCCAFLRSSVEARCALIGQLSSAL